MQYLATHPAPEAAPPLVDDRVSLLGPVPAPPNHSLTGIGSLPDAREPPIPFDFSSASDLGFGHGGARAEAEFGAEFAELAELAASESESVGSLSLGNLNMFRSGARAPAFAAMGTPGLSSDARRLHQEILKGVSDKLQDILSFVGPGVRTTLDVDFSSSSSSERGSERSVRIVLNIKVHDRNAGVASIRAPKSKPAVAAAAAAAAATPKTQRGGKPSAPTFTPATVPRLLTASGAMSSSTATAIAQQAHRFVPVAAAAAASADADTRKRKDREVPTTVITMPITMVTPPSHEASQKCLINTCPIVRRENDALCAQHDLALFRASECENAALLHLIHLAYKVQMAHRDKIASIVAEGELASACMLHRRPWPWMRSTTLTCLLAGGVTFQAYQDALHGIIGCGDGVMTTSHPDDRGKLTLQISGVWDVSLTLCALRPGGGSDDVYISRAGQKAYPCGAVCIPCYMPQNAKHSVKWPRKNNGVPQRAMPLDISGMHCLYNLRWFEYPIPPLRTPIMSTGEPAELTAFYKMMDEAAGQDEEEECDEAAPAAPAPPPPTCSLGGKVYEL